MECISKGKARSRYEFGCKVSIATNLHPAKGGHFLLLARALHGNRSTATHCKWLSTTSRTSSGVVRYALDHGYKGTASPAIPHCGVHHRAKRGRHRQDQTLVKAPRGDCCNALLAAAGFNLRQLLRFLSSAPYFFCARFYLRSRPPSILFRQPRPLSKSNNDFLNPASAGWCYRKIF